MTSISTDREMQMLRLRRAAFLVLGRRRKANKANQESERAEEKFMELAAEFGVSRVDLDEATVQVIEAEKRTVSVDTLAAVVPEETLEKVTKRTVDMQRFDQAVALGLILESIARAATKVTAYKNVRVNVH